MKFHCMVPLSGHCCPVFPQKSNFLRSYRKRQQDGDNVDFVYFMQNMSTFYRLKLWSICQGRVSSILIRLRRGPRGRFGLLGLGLIWGALSLFDNCKWCLVAQPGCSCRKLRGDAACFEEKDIQVRHRACLTMTKMYSDRENESDSQARLAF